MSPLDTLLDPVLLELSKALEKKSAETLQLILVYSMYFLDSETYLFTLCDYEAMVENGSLLRPFGGLLVGKSTFINHSAVILGFLK